MQGRQASTPSLRCEMGILIAAGSRGTNQRLNGRRAPHKGEQRVSPPVAHIRYGVAAAESMGARA